MKTVSVLFKDIIFTCADVDTLDRVMIVKMVKDIMNGDGPKVYPLLRESGQGTYFVETELLLCFVLNCLGFNSIQAIIKDKL